MKHFGCILDSGRHLLRDHPLPAAAPHGERQVPGPVGGDGGPGDSAADQGAAARRRGALRGDGEGLAPLPRDHVPPTGPALPRVGQDEVGGGKRCLYTVDIGFIWSTVLSNKS